MILSLYQQIKAGGNWVNTAKLKMTNSNYSYSVEKNSTANYKGNDADLINIEILAEGLTQAEAQRLVFKLACEECESWEFLNDWEYAWGHNQTHIYFYHHSDKTLVGKLWDWKIQIRDTCFEILENKIS